MVLSRRPSIMKFSRVINRIKGLNGEKTNVLTIISVLVLRVLVWRELHYTFILSMACLALTNSANYNIVMIAYNDSLLPA